MMVSEDLGYSQHLEHYLECFLCILKVNPTNILHVDLSGL